MKISRYDSRQIFTNKDKNYQKTFFKDRGIKQVQQYATGRFIPINAKQRSSLTNISATWSSNLRLHNLAHEYYGDPNLWWVICLYNNKSSVFDFEEGETFSIPTPLDQVLSYMRM